MSKKKFGKFVALATVSGVIAAGISYFLKYKSFHDELDEDFHDFEGDDEFDGSLPHASETPNRTYVTLSEKADEAAGLVKDSADHAAEAAKKVTGHVVDAAREAVVHAVDTARDAAHLSADAAQNMAERTRDAAHFSADIAQNMAERAADTARDAAHFSADIAREVKEHAADAARDAGHYFSAGSAANTASHTTDTASHLDGAGNAASAGSPSDYNQDARDVVKTAVNLMESLSGSAREWPREEKDAEKDTADKGRDVSGSTTIVEDDLQ